MLARELASDLNKPTPIILSHGMVVGLKGKQEKMSKSDAVSAIFMEDTLEDLKRKIKKAFCPPGNYVGINPILEYFK